MSIRTNTASAQKVLATGIALIQLLDIIIHAATDQLEVMRVSSNGIILLWLVSRLSGRAAAKSALTAISANGFYLILNLIFLAREGFTNPDQGGELRMTLFLLVFLTTTLSLLLAFLSRNRRAK